VPTYEYKCQTCGHTFEKFQNIKDKPVSKCLKCNHKVQRLIGAGAGVIFRNSKADYSAGGTTSCNRETPCCGRDVPCDKRPCES